MHGLRSGLLGDRQDPVDVQVALRGRRRTARVRLVSVADVQGIAVGVGIDGDGPDAELAAGANHAHRDLAAVRDQHLFKGRPLAHNGMFPCFFGGFASFLFSSMASASTIRGRVSSGMITASM